MVGWKKKSVEITFPLYPDDSTSFVPITEAITIVNQLAEEYKCCALCYLGSPCEYQNENAILPVSEFADGKGWIPCSERLPEDGQEVLAYCDNIHCSGINVVRFERGKTKEELQSMEHLCISCKDEWGNNLKPYARFEDGPMVWFGQGVIAWQPLPEPFKPKGE